MPKNNRVRRKRCNCFGRTGERPHVCDECGRKFVYCTSFQKHVITHRNGGGLIDDDDDCGTFRFANGGGPLANGHPGALDDGSRAAALFVRDATANGPNASDTPTSTTTTGHADGSPSRAAAAVGPLGADGRFHGDSGDTVQVDVSSEVIVISSDSSSDAEDTCDDGPNSRNAAAKYDVPLLSDISDASDGDDDHTGEPDVQQTIPVDLSSASRGNPCAVCSLCYIASSAAVYRCIICPNVPTCRRGDYENAI